jgi:hypothetical protein
MNSKRLFILLVSILFLVNASGIALLVMGNKYLDKQNSKLTELKVESDTLDVVQRSLIRAKKDVETYTDLANVVAAVVPQEKDQARTVREIVKIASESGISITSINFPNSTLGTAATATNTGGQPSATAATSGTTNTQTQKVTGINNVERLEITVQSGTAVPFKNFILFLQKLEQNRRTAQVSNVSINPNTENPNYVQFSLVLNVYIKKAGS